LTNFRTLGFEPKYHIKNQDGDGLLHFAARCSSCLCIELLLDKYKFLANELNMRKETALHIAASNGHQKTVGLLLQHMANPDNPNLKKETTLHIAAKTNSITVMQLLMNSSCDVDAKDCHGQTPLHIVVNSKEKGGSSCIVLLSKWNADLNLGDQHGMTALHLAAIGMRFNRVRILIKEGADLCARNDQGDSAINFVMKYTPSCIQTIEEKLDSGIHIDWMSDVVNDDTRQNQFRSTLKIDFNHVIPTSLKTGNSLGSDVRLLHELLKIYYNNKTECIERVLMHPLSLCFLHFKWQQISFFYYFILFSHLIFSVIYSGYVLLVYTNLCVPIPSILKNGLQDELEDKIPLDVKKSCFNKENGVNCIIGLWSLLLIFVILYIVSQISKILHLKKKYV
jgi:ankyrin repeat protein